MRVYNSLLTTKSGSIIMAKANEIKYLTAIKADKRPKNTAVSGNGHSLCGYKDADFLKKFWTSKGKIASPHHRNSLWNFQRKVGQAVKESRQMALSFLT